MLLVPLSVELVGPGGTEEVSLPPVQQTELTAAARAAGCELRRHAGERPGDPPTEGPAAPPAEPGVYDSPRPSGALIRAIRRGVTVIYHRRALNEDRLEQLERLQRAVPAGTIVTPDDDLRYELAVTAWRRILTCPRISDRAIDAMRLFRGRFIGSGPDRGM